MIFLALFLSVMISDAFACSYNKCESLSLPIELISVRFLPNQEQLRKLCPKFVTFLDCQIEDLECSGPSFEEMIDSSNKTEAIEAKKMLGIKNLVHDLCDENSSFHQDYIGSLDCIRDYIEKAGSLCDQDYMALLDKFYIDLSPREDTSRFEVWDEMVCLSDALEMTCLILNLCESCGIVAERTAMTALQRMKPFLKAGNCANVEYKEYLKLNLLHFLNLDDERKNKIEKIFKLF